MKIHILALSLLLLPLTAIAALPDNSNPNNFIGPSGRIGISQVISPFAAYAIQGEMGNRINRLNGTLNFLIADNQRLKLSGEYLNENLTYGFSFGNTSQWNPQAAFGLNYVFDLGKYLFDYDPSIGFDAYISHSQSKNLRINRGTYTNAVGVAVPYVDKTRIAGSTAVSVSPGIYIHPWAGARTGIELNYDNVQYNNFYLGAEDPTGFGGTVRYQQLIANDVSVGVSAGRRQPFNLFQAKLAWEALPFFGLWAIGINADYLIGKDRLPSSYDVGVSFDYFIDQQRYHSYTERSDAIQFLNDTAHSAARMPQVIAARDEAFS